MKLASTRWSATRAASRSRCRPRRTGPAQRVQLLARDDRHQPTRSDMATGDDLGCRSTESSRPGAWALRPEGRGPIRLSARRESARVGRPARRAIRRGTAVPAAVGKRPAPCQAALTPDARRFGRTPEPRLEAAPTGRQRRVIPRHCTRSGALKSSTSRIGPEPSRSRAQIVLPVSVPPMLNVWATQEVRLRVSLRVPGSHTGSRMSFSARASGPFHGSDPTISSALSRTRPSADSGYGRGRLGEPVPAVPWFSGTRQNVGSGWERPGQAEARGMAFPCVGGDSDAASSFGVRPQPSITRGWPRSKPPLRPGRVP